MAGIGFFFFHDEIPLGDHLVLITFFSLASFVLGSHMIVHFSLLLKRGGLPVGLMVGVFFQFILALVIETGMYADEKTKIVLWGLGFLFASCILHFFIGKRLGTLAGED